VGDQLFRIRYDGFVTDEEGATVLGGDADTIAERLRPELADRLELAPALQVAVNALAGPERTLGAKELEAAVLSRTDERRAFRRIEEDELTRLLS
jgi:proteasome alpha subunit